MSAFRVVAAGDAAIVAEFDDRIDVAVNARAVALAEAIRAADIAGVRDVVPAFRSVTVYFDPLRTDQARLTASIESSAASPAAARPASHRRLDVPVCYDVDLGPDLDEVAARVGLQPQDVVTLHTSRTYRVFMVGFVPGFAYLGTLDRRIVLPRRETPRPSVAPGSVGIAGQQTGVYPSQTPGGWHILGRTPLRMFVPDRPGSSLLAAGDTVRFVPVDRAEFTRLAAQGRAA